MLVQSKGPSRKLGGPIFLSLRDHASRCPCLGAVILQDFPPIPQYPFAHLGIVGYTGGMATAPETKQADERGRISLGAEFANCTFIVENEGGTIIIHPARVIPEREAWLYENETALARVRKGLAQARAGEFAKPPSLKAARRLTKRMGDDE